MQFQKTYSVNAEFDRRIPSHVAAFSGDGTAEGGLGKVAYGVGFLGGQALAGDWPRGGRILL